MTIINYYNVPYTSENMLLATSVTMALATALYAPTTGEFRGTLANRAFISVETGDVRYRLLSASPTTMCGHVLAKGDYLILDDVTQMQKLRLYNQGSATSYIHVTYFAG